MSHNNTRSKKLLSLTKINRKTEPRVSDAYEDLNVLSLCKRLKRDEIENKSSIPMLTEKSFTVDVQNVNEKTDIFLNSFQCLDGPSNQEEEKPPVQSTSSNTLKFEDLFLLESQQCIKEEFTENFFKSPIKETAMENKERKMIPEAVDEDIACSLFFSTGNRALNGEMSPETKKVFNPVQEILQTTHVIEETGEYKLLQSKIGVTVMNGSYDNDLDGMIGVFLHNYKETSKSLKIQKQSKNLKPADQLLNTLGICDDSLFVNNDINKDVELVCRLKEDISKNNKENTPILSMQMKSDIVNNKDLSTNNTCFANLTINMSMQNESISGINRKALINNIMNDVSLQKAVNSTLQEEEVDFRHCGPFYGLPEKVEGMIKLYKGIDKLYEWQDECLKLPAVNSRKNLIYALPTSGGKTLVAEILILREIICRQKNVIFILPYVAIVQEKISSLSAFAVELDFLIEEYAAGKGTYPPIKRRRKKSIYICTIEKALGLVNSLIETTRLDEIGLIVIDELHLLGEKSRGCTLECLLTKIISSEEKIQVIGMSATIGNLSEVCKFLHAEKYTNNFRPVKLEEYVKCENEIAKVDYNDEEILVFDKRVNFQYTESLKKIDPDQLGGLVMEVIPNASCLIFCRSKQNCENVALLLCKVVFQNLKKYKSTEKESLKVALKDASGACCKILKTTISYGIAYHHSGLTSEERMAIEMGFREGIISVICCTSTLAAGVNLPARRVIIRHPYIGREFINLSRYKQMVGRAGRAGLGEIGESIVICSAQELEKLKDILRSPMNNVVSGMADDNYKGLSHFLMSCISLGIATSKTQLENIANITLMGIQKERLNINIKTMVRTVIRRLFKLGALEYNKLSSEVDTNNTTIKMDSTFPDTNDLTLNETRQKAVVKLTNDTPLNISKLGMAAMKGGIDLERARILYADLVQAQSCLVLLTGLHLMYLVTPYDVSEQVDPVFSHYYTLYTKLTTRERQTANVIGLTEAVAVKMLTNKRISDVPQRTLKRFYVTLMLYDLWNEMPLYEVATKYEVNRGLIQNLMTNSATFASNVVNFCAQLEELWAFEVLLKGMSERLSHCCVRELVPLMQLPSVKQNRARQLFRAGYKTLQSIANANSEDLVQNIEYMPRKLAKQLIATAKLILLERAENLREEADDVLAGVKL